MKKYAFLLPLLSTVICPVSAQDAEPSITISTKTLTEAKENNSYETTLKARSQNPVEFSLLGGPDGLAISKQGIITWQPNFEQAGKYAVEVQAKSGDVSTKKSFTLVVANSNRLPKLVTDSLAQATEAQAYSANLEASDPDGQTVELSLKKAPKGMNIAENTITWQPGYEQAGEHTIVITAFDGEDKANFTLPINVADTNRAPKIVSQGITQANEGQPYRYTIKGEDPDKQALTYNILSPTDLEGLTLVDNAVQWTPSFTQAGSYPISLEVSDGDLVGQQSFTINVSNHNRLPSINSIAPEALNMAENNVWQQALIAQDADNEPLVFSLFNGPEGLTLNDNILQWQPSFEQAGSHNVTVQVDDGIDKVTTVLTLHVKNTNRAPIFTGVIPEQAKENSPLSFELSASDADKQALSYSLKSAPTGMNIVGNTVTWTPNFNQAGEHIVIFAVNDSETTVTQTKTIMVENTNRAPVFTAAPTSVQETQTYTYNIDATDPDGDTVTVSVIEKPDTISFSDNQLSWTTDYKSAGKYSIALLATDGDLSTEQRFTLVVDNLNRLPKITSKPNTTAYETLSYEYPLSASDADEETLTFSLQSAPKGMEVVDNSTISWTPKYSQQGTHNITIAVSDGIDSVTQSFTVKVDNSNRAPVIASIEDTSIVVGEKLNLQLDITDPDGDKLSFKLPYAPKGMSISRKGLIKFKASEKDIGEHIVVIEATDGDLKSRKRFNLIIEATVK